MIIFSWLCGLATPAQAERRPSEPAGDASSLQGDMSPRLARIQALVPDWRDRCVRLDGRAARTPEQQALRHAILELGRSRLGAWLTRQAMLRSVMLCLDSGTDLEAYYRAHLHLIGLNARLGPAGRLVFLAHELAHVPQHPRFSNNRRFSPEDMLLLQRTREATAEAVATRVLWQLRELGVDTPWRAKLGTAYGDIAYFFEASMANQRGSAAELRATRSSFYHWFDKGWRLDVYDDLMLKTLARIVNDHIGMLPPSMRLSDSYLLDISNYGGERFLLSGDGRTLIGAFAQSWRTPAIQARLDALLGRAPARHAHNGPPVIEGTGLSASSSGPKPGAVQR